MTVLCIFGLHKWSDWIKIKMVNHLERKCAKCSVSEFKGLIYTGSQPVVKDEI